MNATADYRPVSRLAVAALVAGACSALAVVTPFAWVLPLVATGLAIAALADVARPGASKAGRLLALVGLALAVGFGVQAVTATVVDRWIVGRRARVAAGTWIDAIREGRPAAALGISSGAVLPAAEPHRPAAEEPHADRIARFAALPAVQAVAACGPARPGLLAAAPVGSDDGAWAVRFSLADCGGGQAAVRVVVVPRVVAANGPVERWTVDAFDLER